jgi:predicted nucleic acid-binding protein
MGSKDQTRALEPGQKVATMILVDSNILIRFSRGDHEAANWLKTNGVNDELMVSVVTELELLVGSRDKRHLKEIKTFLSRFPVIDITPEISRRATELIEEYNLSQNLQVADSLIAATAVVSGFALATINKKDFRYIRGLKLVDYP